MRTSIVGSVGFLEGIILQRSELSIEIDLDVIPVTAEDECEEGPMEVQKRLVRSMECRDLRAKKFKRESSRA